METQLLRLLLFFFFFYLLHYGKSTIMQLSLKSAHKPSEMLAVTVFRWLMRQSRALRNKIMLQRSIVHNKTLRMVRGRVENKRFCP